MEAFAAYLRSEGPLRDGTMPRAAAKKKA